MVAVESSILTSARTTDIKSNSYQTTQILNLMSLVLSLQGRGSALAIGVKKVGLAYFRVKTPIRLL